MAETRGTKQKMVEWLEPRVLLHTAQEVVLSALFANFADKRETMAGHDASSFHYERAPTPFWLDYVSDLGDGFDSTYTIAHLVGREELEIDGEPTQRGSVLVLGGDEVYPSARWDRYDARFRWPYQLATLHEAVGSRRDDAPLPHLFAIPGNHDWYDGLTSFARVFCQRAAIGAWSTRQRRSYFALKLPAGWWLWGIDIQFDAYIDGPQIEYFEAVAEHTKDGDQIILATAKPSWVHVGDQRNPQSWKSLAWFDDQVICKHGARLALTVTGDLHHYSRYDQQGSDETTTIGGKITAGGGGAYLSPTHWLPEHVDLPALQRHAPKTRYTRRSRWPAAEESRKLRNGIRRHLLPDRTWRLGKLLAGSYAVTALLLAAGIRDQDTDFSAALNAGWLDLLGDSLTPWFVVLAGALIYGMIRWARYGDAGGVAGALHGMAHVALAWAATITAMTWIDLSDRGFLLGYVAAAIVALVGVVLGRVILVLYLWLCNLYDDAWHANEVFAAQSLTAYKNFLRLRIDEQGLTVYAVGVKAPPRWTVHEHGAPTIEAGTLEWTLLERLTVVPPAPPMP